MTGRAWTAGRGVRRLVAVAVATLAVASIAAVPAAPAEAATSDVLVSEDGVNFVPEISTGLFDGLGLLVPLESIETGLWVRNQSTVPASIRLTMSSLTGSSTIFDANVTVSAVYGSREWSRTLSQLKNCRALIPSLAIPAGATIRIDLSATMGDLDGQDAQNESAALRLRLLARDAEVAFPTSPCSGLTDPDDGDGDPDGGDPDGGSGDPDGGGGTGGNGSEGTGGLSGTGVNVVSMVVLSAALVAMGFVLVIARRRDRREPE